MIYVTGKPGDDALGWMTDDQTPPTTNDRDRQLIALRAASPKRANPGSVIVTQDDASDCPLFAAANQERLL